MVRSTARSGSPTAAGGLLRGLSLLCLLGGLLCAPLTARASTNSDLSYSRSQVFSGALRYLRIDLGYEITEQDPEAAYLLFRFQISGQREPTFGAFEIVQTDNGVKLWVKLPKLPAYHETVLRDGLLQKLREDYGEGSVAPKPDKPAPKPDPKKRSARDKAGTPPPPPEGEEGEPSEPAEPTEPTEPRENT